MRHPPGRPIAAWAVHVYTATGSVLGLLIVLAAIDGDVARALWLGLVALVVDGTDGMLARRLRVKDRIPWFDGARLDDIVDYLTYAFAPVVLLLTAGFLPAGAAGTAVAAIPLLASSYQFCRVDAKTDDHLFLGFPSYWNVLAFYAVALDLSPTTVAAILIACSVLVFVPIGYVYPSRTVVLRRTTLVLTALWVVSCAGILLHPADPHPVWLVVSCGYVAYYVLLSVRLTVARRRDDERSSYASRHESARAGTATSPGIE